MPEVTLLSSPKGLPTAITHSPTSSCSESPRSAVGKLPSLSIFMTATSVFGSFPRTFASNSLLSESLTIIFLALSITWAFVTMEPSDPIIKPEPRLRCCCCDPPDGGLGPKNFSKNSSMGCFSGLGRPRGAGPAAICVVDTLTTIGWSFFASVTKSGDPLDGAVPLLLAKNLPESSVFLPEQPRPIPVIKNSVNITVLRIIFLQGLPPKTKFVALRIFHLPRLNGQHRDIEIQSFARERVIKIKNNCFLFHFMDLDNNIFSLRSADAEGDPNLERLRKNFGLRDFLEGFGINRPVRFLR